MIYDEHYEPKPLTPTHFINFGQNQQIYPVTFVENRSDRLSLLKERSTKYNCGPDGSSSIHIEVHT